MLRRIIAKYRPHMNSDRDILSMLQLMPLSTSYIPWSSSTIRPLDLVTILNEIAIYDRKCIVECGAGVSTLFIAKLLEQKGGHLYSIEHDKKWADFMQSWLHRENLEVFVSVIHAPLVPSTLGLADNYWYDTRSIESTLGKRKVDFLLVDGPPAYTDGLKYARYPALPYFKSSLALSHTVVLDDANRSGELKILRTWEAEFGVSFNRTSDYSRIAIMRTSTDFTLSM